MKLLLSILQYLQYLHTILFTYVVEELRKQKMGKQPRAWKQQKATTNPGLEGQKEEAVLLKSRSTEEARTTGQQEPGRRCSLR